MYGFRSDPAATGIGVAFTHRWGGVSEGPFEALNLGRTDLDHSASVVENFARLRDSLAVDSVHVVHQVHGTTVHEVTTEEAAGWSPTSPLGDGAPGQDPLPVADAVVTGVPGAAIAIRVADCLPVLLAAPRERLVAAVHAGRVGLLSGVVQATIEAMRRRGAGEISAWIGPHICGDCYEVPATMAAHAAEILPATAARTTWGTPAIDLAAGAVAVLAEAGIGVEHVGPCTRTDPSYFSHRSDPAAGRQAGVIWIAR
ncbi:polyphenol oxidase family protein [Propionicicella superfundia]|uniref:polyphenol oxidase family protein n=1 Tax=Propionicicella superfundia TaxID=348582 RepID=UPI000413CB8D|nr:polyphenol oxidase family protein [Propionicicella superfundia]